MREKIISLALVVIAIFFLPIFITSVLTGFGERNQEKEEKLIKIKYDEKEVELPLDEYLIGAVAAQIPAHFEEQTLKVQAIISRTFTIKKNRENPDLVFTKELQGYYSNQELEDMWGVNDYAFYYSKIRDAVESTKNLVITYNNELIDPVFHLVNIGITRSAKDTWGQDIPYLQSSESLGDIHSPQYTNRHSFSFKEFQDKLVLNSPDIKFTEEIQNEIQIIERNNQEYVLSIQIGNKIFTGEEFRKAFGLSSSNFEIIFNDDNLDIICKGFGHGVGLSQYGADYLANEGNTYEDILKHYYKGVVIEENK